MPDPDAVKRLLSAEISPTEIENDAALYSMAERIYGAEALEELGVSAPEITSHTEALQPAPITSDVSLPDFNPEISEMKSYDANRKGSRRYLLFFTGLMGIAGVAFNMAVGVGRVLCSIGIADMRSICDDEFGQTKVVWTEGYTWEGLHQVETWVKPMSEPLLGDLLLLFVFFILAAMGLILRKKSVHSGDVLPLGG